MEGTSKSGVSQKGEDEFWEVEKILDKRINHGVVEYQLRWSGWGPEWDSWETMENVDCPELVYWFEDKLKRKMAAKERSRHEPKVRPLFAPKEPTGFDKGLTAEAITGVTKLDNEIIYFVKWKNEDKQGIIPGHVAKKKCPRLVIEYMENNIRRNDQHSN
ncbi:chromobox protein homolog 3-like [Panonychus citri]|uniref:chromobox protein homolog 3-like n=1 Tax=Panonychus citri TaxID=50023 RepID=UPI002307F500|nr:chromobox protein homolog 3-like [Panonychus citri]XP_053214226.1 chromobox protein homolog 3-like [Panonychus citri]